MTKLRTNCNEDEEPVIIQINQGRSCDCHAEGKEPKRDCYKEAAPFPFKGETNTACPVYLGDKKTVISSDGSESTLSVVPINSPPNKLPLELPLVTPRDHGSHCALEVSVFEKHADGCSFKKREKEGRNPIDDKAGSYDVVNRMVYRTCVGNGSIDDHGDVIKNSLKSFRLNDPNFFGKDLKVKRSRIETLPILPNYDNCIMRAQAQNTRNPFEYDDSRRNSPKTMMVDDKPVCPQVLKSVNPNMEVLSVYIRKDKGEKIPPGFQKLHYRGDSCKLHNPDERTKQILALQKVISETSSGAEIAKSNRRFSPLLEKDTKVMAAVGSPLQLPKSLYAPVSSESDDSVESYNITKKPTIPDRDESIDVLPQRRSIQPPVDDDDSRAGLFGCFKRGKAKRQQRESYEEERHFHNRRVTHSDSPPKRHSGSMPHGQRKISAEYANRRNY